ncbi:Ankyrin repeat domain-containing protein [Balamuthia mandrillaris]
MEEASEEAYPSSSSSFYAAPPPSCYVKTSVAHGGGCAVALSGHQHHRHLPHSTHLMEPQHFYHQQQPQISSSGNAVPPYSFDFARPSTFSMATPALFGSKEQELLWYQQQYQKLNNAAAQQPPLLPRDGFVFDDVERLIPLLKGNSLSAAAAPAASTNFAGGAASTASFSSQTLPFLLKQRCGGALDKRDKQGNTALMWAVIEGREDLVVALIRAGCDVNMQNYNGENALMYAASKGFERMVLLLLQCGAHPNIATMEGATPLHFAAYLGYERIVSILCEHGAHVNAKDEEGDTAIHWAVRRKGNDFVIKRLLAYGADLNALNADYESALSLAKSVNEDKTVGVLLSLGAKA